MSTETRMNQPVSQPKPAATTVSKTMLSKESTIVGEIKGNSDVSISGIFEGNVSIPNNTATIELSGKAQATISAKEVIVHGTIKGNLYGSDTIHVLSTGVVEGDIQATNVILEKSCTFNGSVQMLTEKPSANQGNKPTADRPVQPKPAMAATEKK